MLQVMLSLGMSIRKCSEDIKILGFAAGPAVPVPGNPVSAAPAADTPDPNFTCGVAYRTSDCQQEIAARHGHTSSLIWRGVGLLQEGKVHRAYLCASYMAVSSACHMQAMQAGISRVIQCELVCKACKAAENACSEMGLTEAASQRVLTWDHATSPVEKLERCIFEVSLLNFEACLSACAQMCCSSHPIPAAGPSMNSLRENTTCQQIKVASAILQSFQCNSHPLQADSRVHLEVVWVKRLSSLVTSTAYLPAEVKALVLHQCALNINTDAPDLLLGGDLHT